MINDYLQKKEIPDSFITAKYSQFTEIPIHKIKNQGVGRHIYQLIIYRIHEMGCGLFIDFEYDCFADIFKIRERVHQIYQTITH